MNSGEDVLNEFSLSLSSDPLIRVEQFLAQSTTQVYVDVKRLVLAEMASRIKSGEALSESEYRQRFPHLTDEITLMISTAADLASGRISDSAIIEHGTANVHRSEADIGRPLQKLGDHDLLEVIGRGGMGIVYKAHQTKLNRIVAVKTIVTGKQSDAVASERFRREAEAAARLSHPGIVPVYEIGEEDGVLYFSMGFVPGISLADYLRDNTLSPKRAAEVVGQIAAAVQYAHNAGVVHRDLKPANILLDDNDCARIVDFGLAQMIDRDGLTMTGATVGTPSYMSPEQASGLFPVGPISDVYGLGAILYACLSGNPPFRGPSAVATLNMVMHDRPTPLHQLRSDIPKDLQTICEKCLEKYPASRYESADELAKELQRFLGGHPILARPVPAWIRFGRWCRRNPAVAGLITTVAVTLVIGTVVSLYFAILAEGRATTAELATKDAELKSSLAREQSQLALKSLQTNIYGVQQRLRDIPEAREVRRELLTQALADLQQVSGRYIEQAIVDRDVAKALADIAELYTEIGDEVGTDVVELSAAHFRQSVEIYLKLLKESPDDDELVSNAYSTIAAYGDTAREYVQFDQAVWAHTRGRQVAEQWYRRSPENPDAQLAFLASSEALGEALLRSGKKEECRAYILEAADLVTDYYERHPTIAACENQVRCYCTAGDYYRIVGDFDAAEAEYSRMCAATMRLTELMPGDPKWLDNQSADQERLGDLEMARKNYAKARQHFEESLRLSQLYMADDPANLFRVQQATWSYKKLADVCRVQGDAERESALRTELAELQRRLKGRAEDSQP